MTTALRKGMYRAFIAAWCAARPLLAWLNRHAETYCPVCEHRSGFVLPASGGVCTLCFSRPRHRLSWLYMRSRTNLFDAVPKRLLHLAPEMEFARRMRAIPGVDYVSADLDHPGAMRRVDLTAIDWPDASFDVVYCSHVLEHIPADRVAMGELYRVLRPAGWMLVQVPVNPGAATQEDLSITDPRVRTRLYGQWDHVRLYGLDVADRLRAAGFEVGTVMGSEVVAQDDCRRMRINPREPLFVCRKPAVTIGEPVRAAAIEAR